MLYGLFIHNYKKSNLIYNDIKQENSYLEVRPEKGGVQRKEAFPKTEDCFILPTVSKA